MKLDRHFFVVAAVGLFGFSLCSGCSDGGPIAESDADVDTEIEGSHESDGDIEPEYDADSEPEYDADSEPEYDADSEPENDGDVEAEFDGDIDSDMDEESDAIVRGYVLMNESFWSDEFSSDAYAIFQENLSVLTTYREPYLEDVCGRERFGDCYFDNLPNCMPECSYPEICVWNDDCSAGHCVHSSTLFHSSTLDAGIISITGGTHQPTVSCSIVDGVYESDAEQREWWDDGDILTVSAPGETFPSFSVDFTAPGEVGLTTDTSGWTRETFDGSTDISLDWDGVSEQEQVMIAVEREDFLPPLFCITDNDGSFEIPDEALSMISPDEILEIGLLRFIQVITKEDENGEVLVMAMGVETFVGLPE